MSLLIDEQPAVEPVSVDDVKARLRLDTSADDAMILQNITASREFCEKVTRRSLIYKGYKAYFDRFPSPNHPIRVPAPPLITVTGIFYLDASYEQQEWDAAEYFVANKQEPALILPKTGFVYPVTACAPDTMWVQFHAGYSFESYGDAARPIPEHLRLAVMELAVHMYLHPETISSDISTELPHGFMAKLRANQIYVI